MLCSPNLPSMFCFFFPEFPLRSDIELYCHVSLGFFNLKFFHNPIQPTLKTSKQKHQSRAPEMTLGSRTCSTPPEILNSQQVAQNLICEFIHPQGTWCHVCSLWTSVHTYQCAPNTCIIKDLKPVNLKASGSSFFRV